MCSPVMIRFLWQMLSLAADLIIVMTFVESLKVLPREVTVYPEQCSMHCYVDTSRYTSTTPGLKSVIVCRTLLSV